jgi:hypothetical protein
VAQQPNWDLGHLNFEVYRSHTHLVGLLWTRDQLMLEAVKTRVIPVIIGATGTISKSFRKYVSVFSS